ncbi:acyl-CoA synthetase [Mycobacterium triplex]|uniref:AMP-dependent synthetase and ligase n=1 Tax=Mycobacterium triplex TaxID=47839 RepID=A0A024K356_9MYCO|nr:AMP-binding protein [Mycobacterium triplex]ORW99964.1 acyl-CoA synthetase [Mycobacterium triplex]CDO90209.1 AMP-dependent synthetase and ligase [Mycobacterium triplex]
MSIEHYATDVVDYHCHRRPDRPAIEDARSGEVHTWRELEDRVAGLAGALTDDLGVGRGDRVAVLAANHPWILILQFACMRIGAILVPLNFRLAQPELEFCCADSEPAVLVHDATWGDVAARVGAAARVPRLASFDAEGAGYDIVAAAEGASRRSARPTVEVTDPVQLIYTSGTTGRPKAAICTHRMLHYQMLNSLDPYELTSRSRYLAVLPFFHAAGLNSMTNPILALGGTVAIVPAFDPAEVVRLLSDPAQGFTHFSGAPVMYQVMAGVPAFADADFGHLTHGQVGGGFLNYEVTKAFYDRGWPLSPGYGATEMGPIVSVVRTSDTLTKFGSCGDPVQYTNIRIVGPDGRDVGVGEAGELWANGPAVTVGYWRRNRDDDASFAGDWFRTGDAVKRDEDGFLTMVDRFKDMYKSGGENVYPAEVERVLHEHPDVADAAVIPIVDERWGEVGRALIVLNPGAELDRDALAGHCRERLARYKVPAEFMAVEPFERNVTGKLPKADLKKRYGSLTPTVSAQ